MDYSVAFPETVSSARSSTVTALLRSAAIAACSFTAQHIQDLYGLDRGYHHQSKGRLKLKKVIQPGRWRIFVYSQMELNEILDRRAGKTDDGEWIVNPDVWHDAEGNWYSSGWIACKLGQDRHGVGHLRTMGYLTKHKEVPLGSRRKGGITIVHHESETLPLVGMKPIRETNESYANATPETPRLRPTWQERKETVCKIISDLGRDSDGYHASGKKILKELKSRRIPQRPAITWQIIGELKQEGRYSNPT